MTSKRPLLILALLLPFASPCGILAQELVRLAEAVRPGYQYHVSVRVRLTGKLSVPIAPGQPPQMVDMSGDSGLEYDERILPTDNTTTGKSLRIYRQVDFRRTVGDRPQQATLRTNVRRLVLVRKDNTEVPFSPDGALTWGELDLIRTDVYSPALLGFLPPRAVRPGETWAASTDALKELTDMEMIDQGSVEVTFEQITIVGQRRLAQLRYKGSVRGVNEDGPNKQTLEGTIYFDLESNHLSYLYLSGLSELLDKDGKSVGRIEGKFTLTRQIASHAELSDAAIGRLELDANASNTLLFYDDPDLGVQFIHPRNWRVSATHGRQITIDETRGSGLLLTIEPPDRVPPVQQYQKESQDLLAKYNAKLSRPVGPERVLGTPHEISHFGFDADVGGQSSVLDYYVIRQTPAGATMAGRLRTDDRENLMREVQGIAKTLRLTRTPEIKQK